jgi:hypothetical protein
VLQKYAVAKFRNLTQFMKSGPVTQMDLKLLALFPFAIPSLAHQTVALPLPIAGFVPHWVGQDAEDRPNSATLTRTCVPIPRVRILPILQLLAKETPLDFGLISVVTERFKRLVPTIRWCNVVFFKLSVPFWMFSEPLLPFSIHPFLSLPMRASVVVRHLSLKP